MAKLTKTRKRDAMADGKLILSNSPGLSDDFPASFKLMLHGGYAGKKELAIFYTLNLSNAEARRLHAWLANKLEPST